MYFSISAPQSVTLPSPAGPITLDFRVNAQDSSLCEIHIVGKDGEDVAGTHILTFKRNGGPSDTSFTPTPQIEPTAAPAPTKPAYKSVDDGAVRADDWQTEDTQQGMYGSNKPSAKPSSDNKPAA